jgi:hypothetical protein
VIATCAPCAAKAAAIPFPCAAKAAAIPFPMPLVPPVTSTERPLMDVNMAAS